MHVLSKILLPVDFSERSAGAAHYANLLATRFHSELTVLHVLAPLQSESSRRSRRVHAGRFVPNRSAQVSGELDRFVAAHLAGLKVQRVVLEGDPALRSWSSRTIRPPV